MKILFRKKYIIPKIKFSLYCKFDDLIEDYKSIIHEINVSDIIIPIEFNEKVAIFLTHCLNMGHMICIDDNFTMNDFNQFKKEQSKVIHLAGLPHDVTQPELEAWFSGQGIRPTSLSMIKSPDHQIYQIIKLSN